MREQRIEEGGKKLGVEGENEEIVEKGTDFLRLKFLFRRPKSAYYSHVTSIRTLPTSYADWSFFQNIYQNLIGLLLIYLQAIINLSIHTINYRNFVASFYPFIITFFLSC